MPLPIAVVWSVWFTRIAQPLSCRSSAAGLALAIITLGLLGLASPAGAAAPTTQDKCSWDRPGANPFTGDVVAAVDRYRDIPVAVRAALKTRIAKRNYDEMATIGRDSISGAQRYSPEIRDMHFGTGRVCRSVTRAGWPASAQERGLVYCEQGHCLIVPTVCRNVSRVTRLAPGAAAGGGAAAPGGTAGADGAATTAPTHQEASAAAHDTNELLFEAPSAGPAGGSSSEALPMAANGALQGLSLGEPGTPNKGLIAGAAAAAAAVTFEGASTAPGATNGTPVVGWGAGAAGSTSPWPFPSGSGSGLVVIDTAPTPAVPEPASAWMVLAGLAVVALARRQQARRNTKTRHAHPIKDQAAAETLK